MFNFPLRPPTATTVAVTTSNPTFTFGASANSQPWNPTGTSSASPLFVFGVGGVQNTSTIRPFGIPPSSTMSANFTPTHFAGTSVFGTNQTAPVFQPTNVFSSNLTGTTVKFNPVSAQGSVSGSTNFPSASVPFSTGLATSTSPFTIGANTASTMNGAGSSNITTSTTPVTTSIFSSTATTNPFNIGSSVTHPPFNFTLNTNTSTPSVFAPRPVVNTSIFSQSTAAMPFSGLTPPTVASSNTFNIPCTTTGGIVPMSNNFPTQPTIPPTNPFSFASSATSILNINASGTTTASTINPPLFTGLSTTQTQPAMTSSSSTILSQAPKQEQNSQQSASITQQQFLAASLLDPYASRGKKEFANIDQIQAPAQSAVVSTLPLTTTMTTSTPIPITIPIQSNARKVPSSRSSVDVNFKLKPVSSSPALNDESKPANHQPIVPTGSVKSTLAGNLTDEEELVLLGRTKMSKLRLSNDSNDSSYQSNSIRSLYPVRRLAEFEKLTNITPPSSLSSSPTTTTVNNERKSRSASENRHVSRIHHSTSSVSPKQSLSPIIQRKSNDHNSQTHRLPILTRNNYYMKPTISELKSLFNDKGLCILKQFTVGHEKYGSVTFYGQINVAGLNLDEIIEINRHEVTVYPDDNHKPAVSEELNIPARITLLGVYPIDRTTREEITDIERIKAVNYHDHLREITKKFDGEFVNYVITDGSWTFMVKHFTRYGLDDESDHLGGKS